LKCRAATEEAHETLDVLCGGTQQELLAH
jgi:hypothetical protein